MDVIRKTIQVKLLHMARWFKQTCNLAGPNWLRACSDCLLCSSTWIFSGKQTCSIRYSIYYIIYQPVWGLRPSCQQDPVHVCSSTIGIISFEMSTAGRYKLEQLLHLQPNLLHLFCCGGHHPTPLFFPQAWARQRLP